MISAIFQKTMERKNSTIPSSFLRFEHHQESGGPNSLLLSA